MSWYGVRCILHDEARQCYEERITVWKADSHDDAVRLAEDEVRAHAEIVGSVYAGLAQSFEMYADVIEPGTEVFSLMRDSKLSPKEYTERFFATDGEHEQVTRD